MISNFILNHDLRRTDLLNRLRGLTNLMKRLFRGSLCPDRERLGLVVILQNLSEFKSGAGFGGGRRTLILMIVVKTRRILCATALRV